MVHIIDKAKEKAKDIKDTVVDNTKDVVDATKESFSAPTRSSSSSSSTITPNPTCLPHHQLLMPLIQKKTIRCRN